MDDKTTVTDHIQSFLIELGKGFALLGKQYHLQVNNKNFYIDLLFYHLNLRCYIVVELKTTAFKPEYAGQLNFYLSAVDDLLRHTEDKPTIGLILCKTKNNITAEYALRGINRPVGVAEYQTKIIKNLPKKFKNSLPSVAEIEAELEKTELPHKKRSPKKRVQEKSKTQKNLKSKVKKS